DGVDRSNETWELSLAGTTSWNRLTTLVVSGRDTVPGTPTTRYLHGAIYDAGRDRMLVWGGWGNIDDRRDTLGVYLRELWQLRLSGADSLIWTKLGVPSTTPEARAYPLLVYDSASDFMIALAGYDGTYRSDNQRYALPIGRWFNYTTVTLPTGLHGHS